MLRPLVLISGWIGRATDAARGLAGPRLRRIVRLADARDRYRRLREENRLLRARLERLDSYRRPHYHPVERLAILEHAARYGLSLERTARTFVVTLQTLLNWKRALEEPSGLVRNVVPTNSLPALAGELSRRIRREWPSWGTRRIAGILARLGLKASRSTVQRRLRARPTPPPGAASCQATSFFSK